MANWVIQNFIYDFNPSIYNYIKFRWSHYHFCKRDDPTITASLYIDNLTSEVEIELSKQTSVNKKSLTLAVIKRILQNKEAKNLLTSFFDNKGRGMDGDELKDFLNKISVLINRAITDEEPVKDTGNSVGEQDFPVRTYVIATHIYLEIHHNELHYETLIRDTTALKEFISARFKANKISGRIADMKSFSYKKILKNKNTGSARGQLIPQIKQIAANPQIFGNDVSKFADRILNEYSDLKR